MPINYKEYHPKWKLISKLIRFKRAKNRCEKCGVPNYAVGYRNNEGNFIPTGGNIEFDLAGEGLKYPSLKPLSYKEARWFADAENENALDGEKYIVIVLTVAHLDQNIKNNKFSNLAALCQKCHLNHDSSHNINSRKYGKNYNKKQIRLWD